MYSNHVKAAQTYSRYQTVRGVILLPANQVSSSLHAEANLFRPTFPLTTCFRIPHEEQKADHATAVCALRWLIRKKLQ